MEELNVKQEKNIVKHLNKGNIKNNTDLIIKKLLNKEINNIIIIIKNKLNIRKNNSIN
jgi:hypothetical protein